MNKHSFSIVGHDFHRFLIPWGGIQNEPRHKFSGRWSHWYSFAQPGGSGGVVIPLVAVLQSWRVLLWALIWNSMDSFLLCTAFILTPISKLRLMVTQRDQRTVVVGTFRRQVCLDPCVTPPYVVCPERLEIYAPGSGRPPGTAYPGVLNVWHDLLKLGGCCLAP